MLLAIEKSAWITKLILVGVFGFLGVWGLNAPSLKAEVSGTVEVVGIDASSKFRLPQEVARVRLGSGEIVTANVLAGVFVLPGDRVQMRVYERVLTQAAHYDVFDKRNELRLDASPTREAPLVRSAASP